MSISLNLSVSVSECVWVSTIEQNIAILTPSTSEWTEWKWSRFSFWRSLITNPQCCIHACMYKNAGNRSQF